MNRVILKPYSKDRFELVSSYYYICTKGSVLVPAGYKTNGADIPRIFWSLFPPNSPEYLSAVVIHDYLCDEGKKKLGDEMFYCALKECGVSAWKAGLFYFWCVALHRIKSALGLDKPYE